MIYRGAELYNVAELLDGDLGSVLDAEARALIDEPGSLPWEKTPGDAAAGQWICRIPDSLRRRLSPRGRIGALQATGCEVRFNLRGDGARLTLQALQRPSIVEVWQGPFVVDWHIIQLEPTTITIGRPQYQGMLEEVDGETPLAFDPGLTRVFLPWRPPVKLLGFEGDVEPPRRDQTPRVRYLAYGSSITHGSLAIRAAATYAQRCAQRLGVDLVNMGFGGGAKLEPELADWLAARTDWDFATLEMGINLIEYVTGDEFERLVDVFVDRIVTTHPEKPVFCIDLYPSRKDREDPARVARMRTIVAEKVASLRSPRVTHLPGPELLRGFTGLSADMLHPSPVGMEEIGERLAARIAERIPNVLAAGGRPGERRPA
jgi:hypothetical protein